MDRERQAAEKQRVYVELRERLITFDLKPGDVLSENALARETDLGRPAMREILGRLEEEGFISVHPQKGAVVTAVDPERIREAVHGHLVLEQNAIRELARRGLSEEEDGYLTAIFTEMRAAYENGDSLGVIRGSVRFREKIFEIAGRDFLGDFFRRTDSDLLRVQYLIYVTYGYKSNGSTQNRHDYSLTEISLLLTQLRERQEEAASMLCANHYSGLLTNASLLQTIHKKYFVPD